jgi:chitinase
LDKAAREKGREDYLITVATSCAGHIYRHYDFAAFGDVVDLVLLMSYDFSGAWSQGVEHHTNLFPSHNGALSVEGAVQAYIKGGVPAHKLVVGVAMYGRAFSNALNPPLNKPFQGVPQLHASCEAGCLDYGVAVSEGFLDLAGQCSPKGFWVSWDDKAKAAFLFNSDTKVAITLDEPQSVQWKGWYVKDKGLAGLMCWELSQDLKGHGYGSLIECMCQALQ